MCYRKHGFPGNSIDKNAKSVKKICSFCGQNGHTVDNCYKKHDFPLGYKINNKGTTVNNVDTTQETKSESWRKKILNYLNFIIDSQNIFMTSQHIKLSFDNYILKHNFF